MRNKKRKALTAIENILARSPEISATDLYNSFSDLIRTRGNMRLQWTQRENDQAFKRMSSDYKPIEVPFLYDTDISQGIPMETGLSPLPGSAESLFQIARDLETSGSAFLTKNSKDLPNRINHDKECNEELYQEKSPDWFGWSEINVGLEMQYPWGKLLLDGRKVIETRAYNLPSALIGKRIEILQSKSGKDKVSAVGNIVSGEEEIKKVVENVGWVIFDRVILYDGREKFESDERKHLVPRDSGYGWKDDTRMIYGWVVKKAVEYDNKVTNKQRTVVKIARRMRSFFEILSGERASKRKYCDKKKFSSGTLSSTSNQQKKKKKRF